MKTVGVRVLKENLSQYINKIKSGESIIVTQRKKEVAIIVPYSIGIDGEEKLLQLIQRGVVHWSWGKPKGMPSRIPSIAENVSDAVLEDRR